MCTFFREVQYLQKLIEYNEKRRKNHLISDKVSNISVFPVRDVVVEILTYVISFYFK